MQSVSHAETMRNSRRVDPQPGTHRRTHALTPLSHAKNQARELFAAFAAAEADKLIETKGLDFVDREEAKRQARQHAEQVRRSPSRSPRSPTFSAPPSSMWGH